MLKSIIDRCVGVRDCNGQRLEQGKRYRSGVANRKSRTLVRVDYDVEQDVMVVVSLTDGSRMRLDELALGCVFEPADEEQAEELTLRARLDRLDELATIAREKLDGIERMACEALEVGVADGSAASDVVMAWVRDGMGTVDSVLAAVDAEREAKCKR